MAAVEERTITIESEEGVALEARLHSGEPGRGAAVISHPHPLYGGSMENNVVLAARGALARLGMSTLRFNFRGVGGSSGSYDDGLGEERDLAAAWSALAERPEGRGGVSVVGYSFGARITAGALSSGAISPPKVALISPPVDFMDHGGLTLPDLPTLVVSGRDDQFGAPSSVDGWLAGQAALKDLRRVTFEGVDHFYWSGTDRLSEELVRFFR